MKYIRSMHQAIKTIADELCKENKTYLRADLAFEQEYILSCVLEKQIVNTDGIKELIPELKRIGNNELDELIELIAWAELTAQPALKINGEYVDTELVKIRFSNLDEEHIIYVLDCLKENTVKINQRRNYLLTCLYNAPSSCAGYYSNLVNHDLYGGG